MYFYYRFMLSILIPTYNYDLSDLLTELKTQLGSVETTVEVLICDDCSSRLDLHEVNLEKALSSGFQYYRNKENLGRTATRDKLAQEAQYDWLLFLDADVLPAQKDFISLYLERINELYDVIFGGIKYSEERPSQEQLLRWTYGRKREVQSISKRNEQPHFIISQNLCITKEMFLKCNTITANGYGLDNLFSANLLKEKAEVLHIDIPVIHLGLETSDQFLKKSLEGIETTVILEERGEIATQLRPIQRVYLKLKRYGLIGFYQVFANGLEGSIKKNLHSRKPNLLLFDIYRLNHLIGLKKKN